MTAWVKIANQSIYGSTCVRYFVVGEGDKLGWGGGKGFDQVS
jgi:hypothetical protein